MDSEANGETARMGQYGGNLLRPMHDDVIDQLVSEQEGTNEELIGIKNNIEELHSMLEEAKAPAENLTELTTKMDGIHKSLASVQDETSKFCQILPLVTELKNDVGSLKTSLVDDVISYIGSSHTLENMGDNSTKFSELENLNCTTVQRDMDSDIEDIDFFNRPCKNPVGATINFYEVHYFVCAGAGTASLWQKNPEDFGTGLAAHKHYQKTHSSEITKKLKGGLCDAQAVQLDDSDSDCWDVLCFKASSKYFFKPEDNSMVRIRGLNESTLPLFYEYIENGKTEGLTVEKLSSNWIFVCCHNAKDSRCGHCGPKIHSALRDEASAIGGTFHIYKCSHVGGHEFAANVITFPSGNWYGYVKPDNVKQLVSLIRFPPSAADEPISTQLGHIWRGCLGMTVEEMKKLSPSPSDTARDSSLTAQSLSKVLSGGGKTSSDAVRKTLTRRRKISPSQMNASVSSSINDRTVSIKGKLNTDTEFIIYWTVIACTLLLILLYSFYLK